ncbi:unnamed protein product [Paramecium octaurelia]|uniref:Uncharacterized protein n=1 Tax=Paramecium octaurelia TaxID=43137 RepID=A0A8S1TS34_PAROT|nr:unnamed protein product [Paramecium octaurelia]
MIIQIYESIEKLLANQDYHHFDSVCYVGLKHSLSIYFLILISFILYLHQNQTIMSGISYMRLKKVWPIMKNDNICALVLTLISSYPLFLDIHLLRLNLFIGLVLYIIDKTTTLIQKLPYFRIIILDILCLFFVEILHLLCFTNFYRLCRIFIEFIRIMLWLLIITYRQQDKTRVLLYASVALQFFWVYIYFFKN